MDLSHGAIDSSGASDNAPLTSHSLCGAAVVGALFHHVGGPVERGNVCLAPINKRFTGENCLGKSLLTRQLGRERLEYFTTAAIIRVVEQSVVTVPIILPSRMVDDRIQTDALHRHAIRNCGKYFVAQIF